MSYISRATLTAAFQPLAAVLTATTASFTTAKDTKLSGIATGATANSSDATLLARANHTGTQLAATISDFSSATLGIATAVTGLLGTQSVAAFKTGLGLNGTGVMGPAWTDLTFSSSSSAYGQTVYTAAETFVLADETTIEIEAYVYKTSANDGKVYMGDLSNNAYFANHQSNGSYVTWKRVSGSDTSLTTVSSVGSYSAVHLMTLRYTRTAAAAGRFAIAINGIRVPAQAFENPVTAPSIGTVSISLLTSDITKCYARARLIS